MPTLLLPAPLAELAGRREIHVAATTVLQAIRALDTIRPGLSDRICTEQNHPRKHVLIYVNDTEVRQLDGTGTALIQTDTIYIVPSVTGG